LGSTLGLQAGLSCVEYVEQLTMLLFLNMADQLTEPPHSKPPIVPPNLGWKPLLKLDGAALEKQYSDSIEKLGLKPGMLGVIFKGARCDIHNPALFKQLIVNLLRFVLWNFEFPLGTTRLRFRIAKATARCLDVASREGGQPCITPTSLRPKTNPSIGMWVQPKTCRHVWPTTTPAVPRTLRNIVLGNSGGTARLRTGPELKRLKRT
jgi:hypothetical protein